MSRILTYRQRHNQIRILPRSCLRHHNIFCRFSQLACALRRVEELVAGELLAEMAVGAVVEVLGDGVVGEVVADFGAG